ncbi:MAG: hypothetical protein ACREEC_01285, partial [Thermoplasmata archaeon]
WWKDTGRPEDLLEANDRVLETLPASEFVVAGTVAKGARVGERVRLGRGSYVGAGARIDGPTVIGSDVRVDGAARIGPGTAIGDRCLIRGASVRRAIVMEGSEIDGPIDVADSIIGRSARIHAEGKGRGPISCILGDSTQVRL